MPLIYGTGIESPLLSSSEIGSPSPLSLTRPVNSGFNLFTGLLESTTFLGEKLTEYFVKPGFGDGLGANAAESLVNIPAGMVGFINNIASLATGTGDYSGKNIGHTLLQATSLGTAFIPVVGPLLSGAVLASETAWSTVDLAESGHGSWGDYTIMWGAASLTLGFGAQTSIRGIQSGVRGLSNRAEFIKTLNSNIADSNPFVADTLKKIKKDLHSKYKTFTDPHAPGNAGEVFTDTITKNVNSQYQTWEENLTNPYSDFKYDYDKLDKIISTEKYFSKDISTSELEAQEKERQKETQLYNNVRGRLTSLDLVRFDVFTSDMAGRAIMSRAIRNTLFLRKLSPSARNIIFEEYEALFGGTSLRRGLVRVTNQPRGFWKQLKSASFYQNETQFFQDLSGADFGRQGIEMAYSWFKHGGRGKYFVNEHGVMDYKPPRWKGLEKELDERGWKEVSKNLSKAEELESKFIQAGGVVIQSRYLLGYKIIYNGISGTPNVVQISFRTGKTPIIINAFDSDLLKLQQIGSRFWFAVGGSRGWFISRGGRSQIKSNKSWVSRILSIMPVQIIRTFGSMLHNVKDVQNAFRKEGMGYFGTWGKDALSAMFNTFTNRIGRAVTSGFIGYKYGAWAGRASQQVGTAFLNSTIPKLNAEGLQFRGVKHKSQVFSSHMFGTGKGKITNTLVGKRMMSDVKSIIHKQTGVRYVGGNIRKGNIYGSVLGHDTTTSKGWGRGW